VRIAFHKIIHISLLKTNPLTSKIYNEGRADYFGPIVNRAARVTASAEKNEVRLGIPKDELANFRPPQIEDVKVTYVGTKLFKGVDVETALFSCVPFVTKKKWNDKSHRRMSLISDISAHIDR
jgi:hypothetical protein